MKNYKYPHIQWTARAMGILMIITAIITVMIPDVSLLEFAFYHHNLHQNWSGRTWNEQQRWMQMTRYRASHCRERRTGYLLRCKYVKQWDEPPAADGLRSVINANARCKLGREVQRACQSANHGSALVALRPSLTFWPWPWPKCQRSPTRVSADHCKTLARDASPWQRSVHHRWRDGGVLHSVCGNHAHTYTNQVEHHIMGVNLPPI